MLAYADLEISLHHLVDNIYSLEFRYNQPESEADVLPPNLGGSEKPIQAKFDFAALQASELDPAAYGQMLTRSLFAETATIYSNACTSAQTAGLGLRIRLLIHPGAEELHALHWETLLDPLPDPFNATAPLGVNENRPFSRYLYSSDFQPVRLRSRGEQKALIFIASPTDLKDYQLPEIQVGEELERARSSLGELQPTVLPTPEARATLDALISRLRDEKPDILYIVCHGTFKEKETWLWLEDEHGRVARVAGKELVNRFRQLQQLPRLVVLLTCQSAGRGSEEDLSALGPRLAEAGVPAVLAMQGPITVETAKVFMPRFFSELQRDGQIDRALAVARGAVLQQRPDYWRPVLYTRLKSGRLWYTPGFGTGQQDFEKWETLKNFLMEGTCTPIIGCGLSEGWWGSASELAAQWAEKYRYPLLPQERESLPRIVQYIVRRDGPAALRAAYRAALREELMRRFSEVVPGELAGKNTWTTEEILQVLQLAAKREFTNMPTQPHRMLAELRLPLYITVNPDDTLAQALTQAGAHPQQRLFPWWRTNISPKEWRFDDEPTPDYPLVYHLFGRLRTPESLVLSEDDYFDFLLAVERNKKFLPEVVKANLTTTALLFLGFGLDDWSLRVILRILAAQEGSKLMDEYSHVAAQFAPDEDRLLDPYRARRYLEQFLTKQNISLFWGQPEEFLCALKEACEH